MHQLKSWKSYKVMDYEKWDEFLEEVFCLSNKTVDALLMADEFSSGLELEGFLQVMIKGYAVPSAPRVIGKMPSNSHGKKRDLENLIKDLKMLLEYSEFKIGNEILARKQLEQELEKTRAEMYLKVQEKQNLLDKLARNL
jgi:hypothetical protein